MIKFFVFAQQMELTPSLCPIIVVTWRLFSMSHILIDLSILAEAKYFLQEEMDLTITKIIVKITMH